MRQFSTFSAVAALAFCLVVGGATEARAGLGDVIWGMSGPQMIGGVLRCRVPVSGGMTKCNLFGVPIGGEPDTTRERRTWISVDGGIYTSTTKDQEDTDFRAWRTWMLSAEPLFEVASMSRGDVRFSHGVGVAAHFLFGPDFRRFTNAGFKVRYAAVEIGDHVELAYNERYYPNGFTPDQFGFDVPAPAERSFERTWGFSIGYKY